MLVQFSNVVVKFTIVIFDVLLNHLELCHSVSAEMLTGICQFYDVYLADLRHESVREALSWKSKIIHKSKQLRHSVRNTRS